MEDYKVYYVGSQDEVQHHARPLLSKLDLHIVEVEEALCRIKPGDVCLFYTEYSPQYREAIQELNKRNCCTIYAIDGILEWRLAWQLQPGAWCISTMRPVLCQKAACISRAQARILESWGNLGKCELVGLPRLDRMQGRQPRNRTAPEPWTVLVLTAKAPGFTSDQMNCAQKALCDLKAWFESNPSFGDVPVLPRWRLTAGLDKEIGVSNDLRETKGDDLATVLEQVDAVIATPSTAMLEAMLQGLPVALLDYNNCPHYVPAAWAITARNHISEVMKELYAPPQAKMAYQDTILHDNLECHSPATARMVKLVEDMSRISRISQRNEKPLSFPQRILSDPQAGHHLPEARIELQKLYPEHPVFSDMDRATLQVEIARHRMRAKYIDYLERSASLRLAKALTLPGRLIAQWFNK